MGVRGSKRVKKEKFHETVKKETNKQKKKETKREESQEIEL